MNDDRIVDAVRGPSALSARPSNGARVARSLGLAGAHWDLMADSATAVEGLKAGVEAIAAHVASQLKR
jgi:hypothetical protein